MAQVVRCNADAEFPAHAHTVQLESLNAIQNNSARQGHQMATKRTLNPALASALLSLLLVLCQTSADAADGPFPQENTVVLSEGASTCGEFIAEPQMQLVRLSWVLGYISGRNATV